MARRVHEFDWASTPLGPMDRWPRSLRIAAGICLNSRFPMFVWWGPELINIYNDAYIPVLGRRHPEALGRPAAQMWSEIWDVLGNQADRVMKLGEATWNERVLLVMQRKGFTEETYFTWSYSAIPDDAGGIGGVFCACIEETGDVTAQRAGDTLLRRVESERSFLAEGFAQSPSFMALLRGPEHVFEYANDRYLRLVGRGDLVGKTVREVLPEVTGQGFFEILDQVYASGMPFVGTGAKVRVQAGPGAPVEEKVVDFVYQPLRDDAGKVVGILADGVDVTQRYRSEERDRFLLDLESRLRPLVEPEEITASSVRALGEHLKADRCAYAEMSVDGERFTVMGDHMRGGLPSVVGEYRLVDFGERFAELARANRPYVVDDIESYPHAPADLTAYRSTQIRAVVCVPLMKAGRPVALMAVHQKSPRHWRAAEIELLEHVASRCYESIERARVERTLRESEMRFRQLADAMPQIVFAADAEGNVDYFNQRWYEYTGLPEGETGFEAWRQVHTQEGLERVMKAWPEALRTGNPYEIEYPLRRHDGVSRWHLGRAAPIRDGAGRIVRWYGTNTDIHDRKTIEVALEQALEAEQRARSEAELANRMKDEFLATLSHELRTPLNAILGWTHIIKQPAVGPKELAKGAEVIERNARAQATIIEDLLDMSAIISGKVRLEMQRVDLPTLVRAAVETARPTAEARRIALSADIDALRGAEIHGDPNRLQQVFWNLLNNAIKFTPPEGRVEIRVVRRRGGEVEVSVEDTGEGIHADVLPFVFDRFRQADASSTRRHGGLGLGLSIVKQLVELHGGSAHASSPGPGAGSTFTVVLPIRRALPMGARHAEAQAPSPAQPIAIREEDAAQIAGKRVLVVDDEPDARDLLVRLLSECGAAVRTAGSSAEALAVLAAERFDVLVSDIGMPEEDGHALLRKLRAGGAGGNGDIPALALTAYARPEDRLAALRAGFQLHAAKPIEPAELIAMVASLAKRLPSA
jgi:PAS domain S-box-containing protein